ncbi:hypothetical protein BCR43DRAFT_483417 [Syncephalastrum racemosum]|uniref:WRKY domain-containing protein n=1 Tax=Syncephalastrum racemosum TaxID=13706 RepID=A0A1X2HV34_SYNRA|nr:hypothetical protein BCR43DRAFT_483417 [Syncephalastrum racemosum]
MSDYGYPPRDMAPPAKIVPLYHHEQVPFNSFPRSQKQSQQQPQQPQQQHPSQLNEATSTSIPTANPTSTPAATCDLQDVIFYYQSQPELLKLILLSKVEEDKRRAEEAKLRAKELDLLLVQQRQTEQKVNLASSPHQQQQQQQSSRLRRTSLDAILDSPGAGMPGLQRRDSPLASSMGASSATHSEELDDRAFSPIPSSGLFTLPTYTPQAQQSNMYKPVPQHYLDDSFSNQPFSSQPAIVSTHETPLAPASPHKFDVTSSASSPTFAQRYNPYFAQRPRRRREMQAITKIVETRDYPYLDGYFWKNNGNTVQKKTGNKSVYYKCSNSSKGCPVNKTVNWKENGEYLIKYRGEHLPECNKVQRIVDM